MANKKRGFLDPRASRLRLALKLVAPILYFSLNLLLIYLPSAIQPDVKLKDLLTKPDAYGFIVALIFNCIIATVAFYFGRIEEGLVDLSRKLESETVQGYVDEVSRKVEELADVVEKHGLRNRVLDLYFEVKQSDYSTLFGSLAEDRLEELTSELSSMIGEKPHYTLYQREPAEEYIRFFVRIMHRLIDVDSNFDVMTNSTIWSRENFGKDQSYLIANINAVKERKVHIRRIYLVPSLAFLEKEQSDRVATLYSMLASHADAVDGAQGLDLFVYACGTKEEYENRFDNNFAVWSVSGKRVCVVIEYAKDRPRITGVKFTPDSDTVNQKSASFAYHIQKARSAKDFLKDLGHIIEKRGIDTSML